MDHKSDIRTPGVTRRGRPLCLPSSLKEFSVAAIILLLYCLIVYLLFAIGVLSQSGKWLIVIPAIGMMLALIPSSLQFSQRAKLGKKVTAHNGLVCLNCACVLEGLNDRRTCPECGVDFDPRQLRQAWKMWLIRNSLPGGPELTRGQSVDCSASR